jgi:hypothetical protein
MTIEFLCNAYEFPNADEAIQHTDASGRGVAIRLAGRFFVVEPADADRVAAKGVEFAYLCDHVLPDGTHRILTVPVN